MQHEAYRSYQVVSLRAQTAQASPVQLLLILMDGLIEELYRARAHIAAHRYEQKADSLNRCVDMLNGLSTALDADGGDLVVRLGELYDYCVRRLYRAGFELDVGMVDEVVGLLTTLRQGWQHVQEHHA